MSAMQLSTARPAPAASTSRKACAAPAAQRLAAINKPAPFSSGPSSRSAVLRQERRDVRVFAEVKAGTAGAVNDNTFQDLVINSPVPVLLDFWAPWCGPCRMIAPLIDELAAEYGDKIRALKLNTDESPGVATEYGIRSIPTVMIFKNGQKMDTIIGAVPKATLASAVEKYLD